MASRVFNGSGTIAGFDYHHFTLRGKGAHTLFHAHEHDHLTFADRPVAVYCHTKNGWESVEPIGFFDMRVIAAGVDHIVFATEEGETECRCLFPAYDAKGVVANPKQAYTKPYEERCDDTTIPQLIRDHLWG